MKFTASEMFVRIGVSASLAVGGYIKAYLYADGYRDIPSVGPAFLIQASISFTLAVLILVGGPLWLRIAAAVLAAGALVAFVLSRTVGLFGFTELGWQPAPEAAVAVMVEVVTLVFCAATFVHLRLRRRAR